MRLDRDFAVTDDRVAVGGRSATLTTSRGSTFDVFVPLHGEHQSTNAAIAAEAAESVLFAQLDPDVVIDAVESVRLPGRMQLVSRSRSTRDVISGVCTKSAPSRAASRTIATTASRSELAAGSHLDAGGGEDRKGHRLGVSGQVANKASSSSRASSA